MHLFIGNLAEDISALDLRTLFESFGLVTSARLINDTLSRRMRGFGLIEMGDSISAQAALLSLNGRLLYGRALMVAETHAPPRRRTDTGSFGRWAV